MNSCNFQHKILISQNLNNFVKELETVNTLSSINFCTSSPIFKQKGKYESLILWPSTGVRIISFQILEKPKIPDLFQQFLPLKWTNLESYVMVCEHQTKS